MLNSILNHLTQIGICGGLLFVVLIVAGVMLSDGVKTWVKTVVFLLFSEGAVSVLAWIGWQTFRSGNVGGGVVCMIIAFALAVVVLWLAAVHHKTDWKKVE